jgi:hypothetical protein
MYSHHFLSFHDILDLLSNEQQGKHFGAIDPLPAQDEALMAHFLEIFRPLPRRPCSPATILCLPLLQQQQHHKK